MALENFLQEILTLEATAVFVNITAKNMTTNNKVQCYYFIITHIYLQFCTCREQVNTNMLYPYRNFLLNK